MDIAGNFDAMKPGFSPVAIYERGRLETTANQTRYYERFRELLKLGTVIMIGKDETEKWFVLSPSSRLEERVFFAQNLAVDGNAGLHRIEFHEIDYSHEGGETWGDFYDDKGWSLANFRPIAEADTEEWVALWNARSGCASIHLINQ